MPEQPKLPTPNSPKTVGETFSELVQSIRSWFRSFIDLQTGLDREGTIIAIKTNKRMRGANAWLLMCSIMIASLGLDRNSPAVIIGAMLISPLMSPILGIGLAVGINDREALFISLKHFAIAILIALATSFLYFLVTPLGELTDEIQARTAPTLLDSLVAVFGGLAGIISLSRKDKSNAIPGVAIATALMPPLCVTGFGIVYGIRLGNWNIMINSFYLFFLNAFFIALSTYVVIRILNFPHKSYVNQKENLRVRALFAIFSLIIILPSTKILYDVWKSQRVQNNIDRFIQYSVNENDSIPARCIGHSLLTTDTTSQLILELLGQTIPENSREYQVMRMGMNEYGLDTGSMRLRFIQDKDIGTDQIDKMQIQISNLGELADRFEEEQKQKSSQEQRIILLEHQLDSIYRDSIPFTEVYEEAKIIFPKLTSIGFAKAQKTDFSNLADQLPVFFITWDRNKTRSQRLADEKKLYEFLKLRANLDTLQVISYR